MGKYITGINSHIIRFLKNNLIFVRNWRNSIEYIGSIMIEMSKNYQNDLYDIYVSYPPGVDQERIQACLRENLDEELAEKIIDSLASKPQVLVEEKCIWEKRGELHDYFSYLGLDIVTRRYMELETIEQSETEDEVAELPFEDFETDVKEKDKTVSSKSEPLPQNTRLLFLALLVAFLGYLIGKVF